MKFWTPEERELLKQNYISAKSLKELLSLFPDREYNSIRSMANVMGLFRTTPYTKQRDFFQEPNQLNCCIAGFIAADGCIFQNKKDKEHKRLAINLAQKDEQYLLKIKDFLKYSGPLIYSKTNYYFENKTKTKGTTIYQGVGHTCCLQIADIPEWINSFTQHWNITARKTDTLLPPNLTDIKLILSYISGFIDGDGWIYRDKSPDCEVYSIGMMGTLEMMTWIKGIFDKLVPLGSNCNFTKEGKSNSYAYKVSGVKVYWLAKIFLSLDILRMDRKWDILREYIAKVEAGELTTRAKNKIVKVRPSQEILDIFSIPTSSQ